MKYIRVGRPAESKDKQLDIHRSKALIAKEAEALSCYVFLQHLIHNRQRYVNMQWVLRDFQQFDLLRLKLLSNGIRIGLLSSEPAVYLASIIDAYKFTYLRLATEIAQKRAITNMLYYCENIREEIANIQRPMFPDPSSYAGQSLLDHSALAAERKEKARVESIRQHFFDASAEVEEGVDEYIWDRQGKAFYKVVGKGLPLLRVKVEKNHPSTARLFTPVKKDEITIKAQSEYTGFVKKGLGSFSKPVILPRVLMFVLKF